MVSDKLLSLYRTFVQLPKVVRANIPSADISDWVKFRKITKYLESYNWRSQFEELEKRAQIREIQLSELFGPDIEQIQAPYGSVDEGTSKSNQAELYYVNVVARHVKAKNIFEFGTYFGRTTYYLTFASKDAFVTTLDLPPDMGPKTPHTASYFLGSDRESRIRQILCDSREFDPVPFHKKMDFIFIDGDHSYDGVKNDTEKAFEMLAPGGTILWHDYGPGKDLGLATFFAKFTQQVPLFRVGRTSLLLHIDGVAPLTFDVAKGSFA